MARQMAIIAWFTCREALYGKLPWICLLCLLTLVAAATFIGTLAVTGAAALQAGLMGWGARWLGVLMLSLFCVTSVLRDHSDKVIDLLLALPVRREVICLGKMLGIFLLAASFAVLSLLACSLYAPLRTVAHWAVSQWLELCIVGSFALWMAVATGSAAGSILITIGFYLLARSMQAIVVLANGSQLLPASLATQLAAKLAAVCSWLLPPLYAYAPADWLIQAPPQVDLSAQIGHALVYITLLASVAMIEFYRRPF